MGCICVVGGGADGWMRRAKCLIFYYFWKVFSNNFSPPPKPESRCSMMLTLGQEHAIVILPFPERWSRRIHFYIIHRATKTMTIPQN